MDDVLEEDMKVNLDNKIKPIDISTVHRICSGQVVLTLATAVKELVENSLDAGSTSIEIRLKNYGADCIEVIDNGSGIEECNFQALTLKHYTSKLKDFTDLVDVSTFGFRGEALSSLCALSTLSVVTCHHLASTGSRLQFDHNGNLVSTTPYPRQVGTTVLVEQLFSTLPVRHKEFQRNLKKEFAKMVQTLTSYCLISLGVKINCSNQITNRRVTVLNVSGNKSVRENIIDIFGAKQLKSLMELRQCEPTETLCPEFDLTKIPATNRPAIGLSGYVSSAIHGEGRGAADQQYYFINGRPCDPTKVVRLVNDVYHSYNRHQYPFVVLSVQLDSGYADVNVTPDKRQILVLSETLLLATVKASLVEMYQSTVGICPGIAASSMTEEPLSRPVQNRSAMVSGENSPPVTLANLKRTFGSAFAKTTPISKPKQGKLDSFVRECRRDSISTVDSTTTVAGAAANSRSPSSTNLPERNLCESEDPLLDVDASGRADEDPLSGSSTAADGSFLVLTGSSDVTNGDVEDIRRDDGEQFCSVESDSSCLEDDIGPLARVERNEPVSTHLHSKLSKFASLRSRASSSCAISGSGKKLNKRSNRTLVGNVIADDPVSIGQSSPEYGTKGVGQPTSDLSDIDDDVRCQDAADSTDSLPAGDTVGDDVSIDSAVPVVRRSFLLPFSMSRLKETLQCRHLVDTNEGTRHRTFLAKISPSDNHVAESELRKELKKDMFERMEIIGQFNLGFIITRLGRDLFIIDQHATDEKYNFETLQRNTVIKGQKLIQPVPMQLTAVNESILIDNIEVFRKNGFDFVTDTDAPVSQRALLTRVPVSGNWSFGKQDIEEMIFMLSDSPGVLCRPSRIRAMFASRACRSSVMIGTALNKGEMKKLVTHMSEIDQPWNCPHGRPTIRHLFSLDLVS